MKKGFTLIEIVAVLLLVSLLGLASTVAMVPIVEAFLQVRQNAEGAQKTHLALERVSRELTTITEVVSADSHSITYDFLDPDGATHRRHLAWQGAGAPLLLNAVPLSNDVGNLELQYYTMPDGAAHAVWTESCRLIELVLNPTSGPDVYTVRIQPRNLAKRR